MSEDSRTSSTFTFDSTLAFDKNKQAAIVGHVLADNKNNPTGFSLQAVRALKAEWFADPFVARAFGAIVRVFDEHHRKISGQELIKYGEFEKEDERIRAKIQEAILHCMKQSEIYKLDLLREEITGWMHAAMFFQAVTESAKLYNAKKTKDAWTCVEDALLAKTTASFEDGISQGFIESNKRVSNEREKRLEDTKDLATYGISYLDDALIGILNNDVIVIGARTGVGKTELAIRIALHNAAKGKRVHYFALEAEEFEIERRIKYSLLAREYWEDQNHLTANEVSYKTWRMGKLEDQFKKYEPVIAQELQDKLKNLKTLYRDSGDFNLKSLEKNLLAISQKSDLIILDHLHYVDVGTEEENKALKLAIKALRDVALRYGIPVIVIAHLRKNGNARQAPLMPSIDDFHGSSDITKIATAAVIIGRASDRVAVTGDGETMKERMHAKPTYITIAKSRIDGGLSEFTGIMNFNLRESDYEVEYAVGRLAGNGTTWQPVDRVKAPRWSRAHIGEPPPLREDFENPKVPESQKSPAEKSLSNKFAGKKLPA